MNPTMPCLVEYMALHEPERVHQVSLESSPSAAIAAEHKSMREREQRRRTERVERERRENELSV